MRTKLITAVMMVGVLFTACKKEEKFSEIPHISFVSFEKLVDGTGVDNQGKLTIHFQDVTAILVNERYTSPFDTSLSIIQFGGF